MTRRLPFLMLLASGSAVPAAPAVKPALLHCHWDKADELDGGSPGPHLEHRPGRPGTAILCQEPGAFVSSPAKGNIRWDTGTVSFWLSPSWYGNGVRYGKGSHYFLQATASKEQLSLTIGASGHCLLQAQLRKAGATVFRVSQKIGEWVPTEWRHIAVAWDEQAMTLYIDGRKQRRVEPKDQSPALPATAEGTILVGARDARSVPAHGLLDELRIHDVALTEAQVRTRCERDSEALVAIECPDRIPRTVYPGEKVSVRVLNCSKEQRSFEVACRLTDLSRPEPRVRKEWTENLTLAPDKTARVVAYDPNAGESPFGLFEIQVEVRADGRRLARRTIVFGASHRPPDLATAPDAPFGVWTGNMHPSGIRSYPRTSVEPLTHLGHRWLRVIFSWKQVEPEQGKLDWATTDAVVQSAKEHHVLLMPCLTSTPEWATSAPEGYSDRQVRALGIMNRSAFVPEDMADWANFVTRVVSRYGDYVKYWNIWNEPSYGWFLSGWDKEKNRRVPGGSAQEARLYFDLVREASLAAKRADEGAKIVVEPCWGSWCEALMGFNKGELFRLADVFAWHFYSQGEDPEIVIPRIRGYVAAVQQRAPRPIRFWDTEGGIALAWRERNRPMTKVRLAEIIRSNNRGYKWMHWARDEWSHADLTVRDYLVKWGEGVEKVMAGIYSDFQTVCNVCSWRDGSPVVTALATTYLTRTLTGAELVRKLETTESYYAYLFRKDDGHTLVCWTTLDPSHISLMTERPRLTVADIFGNETAMGSQNGVLSLPVSRSPVYVHGVTAEIRAVPEKLKVHPDATLVMAGDTVGLKVELSNPFDGQLAGTLKPELPNGWSAEPAERRAACGPQSAAAYAFTLRTPRTARDGYHMIPVSLTESTGSTVKEARIMVKTAVVCRSMAQPPIIDADLAEWAAIEPLRIDRREQVKIGLVSKELLVIQPFVNHKDRWGGPDDVSAEIRHGWDKGSLYIALTVRDNEVLHKRRFKTFFQGDCLEVFVDLRSLSTRESPIDHRLQVYFIPADDAFPHPSWGVHAGIDKLHDVEMASRKTSDGYIMEIRMPWLNVRGFKPEAGALLGIDYALNDADSDYKDGRTFKSKIVWHGTEKNYMTTELYGLMRLEAPASQKRED